jgi:hypothetical protein
VDDVDIAALLHLKDRAFQAIDEREWAALAALYTDDARFEGFAVSARGGDGFAAALRIHIGDARTVHRWAEPGFTVLGPDRVRATWATHSTVTRVDSLQVFGYQTDLFERAGSTWLISAQIMTRRDSSRLPID